MNTGICGLGLIGGSMARAYAQSGSTVFGYDRNAEVLDYALTAGAVQEKLGSDNIGKLDILFLALYPEACCEYLRKNAPYIGKNCIVMDLCGTKGLVTKTGFSLAKQYGFTYIGAHPMAGAQFSGIKYSRSNLFKAAPMVLVPENENDVALIERVKEILAPAGFGSFSVTTAAEHDKIIAFTSQLAHVVSNAYVKSPTATEHKGFSAGSYKDMTRVAWLNEKMWTELFLENSENLICEIDSIIASLEEYKTALKNSDGETLCALLRDGRIAKENIDGK